MLFKPPSQMYSAACDNFLCGIFVAISSIICGVYSQDCFFYHPNTTEIFTTAFLAIPEDVDTGHVVAVADARIALRVTLQPDDEEGILQDLLRVVIRDNSSVQVVIQRPLTSLLPAIRSLSFHLQCTGPSGAFTSLPFLITILDVNDHTPSFENRFYEITISEFHGIGLTVTPDSIKAWDGDLPNTPNTELSYNISGGNELEYFQIADSADGSIILQKKLDYEAGPRYFRLNITVSDGGQPILSNWTSLVIIVGDEDDQDPIFTKETYDVTVTEEIDSFKSILKVQAWDGDTGLNETLKYEIIDGLHNFLEHFVIDHVSGTISLLQSIDREQLPPSAMGYVLLTVQASQVNDPSRTARCNVHVSVTDINDNGPKFVENRIFKEVDLLPSIFALEHLDLAHLVVFDRDAVQNAGFVTFIEDGGANTTSPMASLFRLDPREGLNQTVALKMHNLTALLHHFETEIVLTVVVADAKRSKRSLWNSSNQNDDFMVDRARVHIMFNPILPNLLRTTADLTDQLPADAKAFMTQYPVTMLIVFGSLICVLLIVILLMAAAYHKVKGRRLQRIRPFLMSSASCSARSSIFSSPISLAVLSSESQA